MATQDIVNYRDFTDNEVRILTGSGEDYNRTRYSAQARASGASPDAVKAAGDRGAERYRKVQEREASGRRVDSNGTAIMDEIRRVGADNTYVDKSGYADSGQSYMGREGNDKIQIVMTDSTAAEEVNHARNFVWRYPKRLGAPTPGGSDSAAYYTHQAGEIQSAMSGALPWIDSTSGNPMWNDGDARRFGADLSDRFRKSGMSASGFVNSLDVPDNTKGMFQGYLENRPGAREYLENDENWRNISSVGFNGSSVGNMAAAKGGKKTTGGQLANFLATDKVPPTIFGIPVVTRREDYTEADIRFFSEHPEAGGYYSMGDEDETPEDGSQGALGGGLTVASIFGPEGLDNLVKAGRKDLPRLAQASTGPDGSGIEFSIGEMKDVRLRKGWEQALLRKKKSLGDLLDFSSPQGQRMLTAYPGLDRIRVTNEPRDGVTDFGRHSKSGEDEYIWINPNHSSYRNKDVGELYDTILHEGINHAIFAREPSFPQRERPYEDLTDFGYAIDLEESIVDLASSRGAKRAMSGRGSADSREFAAKINPHRFARGQAALSAGAEPVIYKSTAASENPGDRSEEALPARKGGK